MTIKIGCCGFPTSRDKYYKDFKVVEADRRPGDPPILTSDATKARTELGWMPELPELEKIVATAWQWHNEHPDGYPD